MSDHCPRAAAAAANSRACPAPPGARCRLGRARHFASTLPWHPECVLGIAGLLAGLPLEVLEETVEPAIEFGIILEQVVVRPIRRRQLIQHLVPAPPVEQG